MRGLQPATVRTQVFALTAYYRFLEHLGVEHSSPLREVKAPRPFLTEREFYSDKDADVILSHALTTEDANDRLGRLLLATMNYTGLRLDELINLKLDQVDLARRRCWKRPKGSDGPDTSALSGSPDRSPQDRPPNACRLALCLCEPPVRTSSGKRGSVRRKGSCSLGVSSAPSRWSGWTTSPARVAAHLCHKTPAERHRYPRHPASAGALRHCHDRLVFTPGRRRSRRCSGCCVP